MPARGDAATTNGKLPEEVVFELGRRAPYSQVGDWVMLSGVDPKASALYWFLYAHVNQKRGDSEVWPGKEIQAVFMKLSRGDKVDPYLKQLVGINAIEIRRERMANGMRTRNKYTIHQQPPEGYAGPRSMKDWYQIHDLVERGQAGTGGLSAAEEPPAQHVPPSGGVRTPVERGSVPPSGGPELYEEELDERTPESLVGRGGAGGSAAADAAGANTDAESLDGEILPEPPTNPPSDAVPSGSPPAAEDADVIKLGTGKLAYNRTGKQAGWPRRTKRGVRLTDPNDFVVTSVMRKWAQQECPQVDLEGETRRFVRYWIGKAGAGATKLDWGGTWQNWFEGARDGVGSRRSVRRPQPAKQTFDDTIGLVGGAW
jgi:hypothetical protein